MRKLGARWVRPWLGGEGRGRGGRLGGWDMARGGVEVCTFVEVVGAQYVTRIALITYISLN